jgi:hypothetical protein
LQKLAGEPFGKVALVMLVAGFGACALWRLLQVADMDQWPKRIGYVGPAGVYGAPIYGTVRHVRIVGGVEQLRRR